MIVEIQNENKLLQTKIDVLKAQLDAIDGKSKSGKFKFKGRDKT